MNNLDEREEKILGKSSGIILAIVALGLIASSAYKVITTKSFDNISLEMLLLLIVIILFYVLNWRASRLFLPKNLKGETLATDNSQKSKKLRLKSYFVDALLLAAGVSALEYITYHFLGVTDALDADDIILFGSANATIAVSLVGCFVILFLGYFISGEIRSKLYNKKLDKLDK